MIQRMAKLIVLLTVFLSLSTSVAASKTAGYGWSVGGASHLDDTTQSYSFIGMRLSVHPLGWRCLDPSAYVDINIGTRNRSVLIHDIQAGIELTLLRTIRHPFHFLMPTNITAFAPSISLSFQWEGTGALRLKFSASPVRLAEKDATYSWFSPFVTVDMANWEFVHWGIALYQISYLVW